MKLHLPSSLRAALLSCFSVAVITFASGSLLLSAQATELYFNSASHIASHITWQEGATFTNDAKPSQPTFTAGDDVVMMGSAVLTLGENVTAGVVSILNKADVTLTGAGNKLTATLVDIGSTSTLRLTDDALATGVKVNGKEDSLLIFDFNGGTAAYDAHLTGYKGRVEVSGCTWQLNPSASTAYSRITLSGDAVLDLGSQSTLKADIVALGNNTLRVASNGSVSMLQGEISGCGTLTKTGAGMLDIGPSDEYFSGTLVIQEGSVRWRGTQVHDEVQDQRNRLSFDTIVVNSGATFEDGHIGRNVSDTTSIVLHGGKVQAYALKNIDGTFNTLTENSYKSLHVEGTGTLDFDFNGGRRFGVVTATAGSTLTVNNGSERSYTALDLIKDFDGIINGEAKTDTHKLIIGEVNEAAGLKLTINPKVSATDFTKSGEGELDMLETLTATRSVNILGGTTTARSAVSTNSLTVGEAATMFTARNNVTATESVSIAADTEVQGNLTAGSVDTQAALSVTGGSLTVNGRTAFSGAADFSAATVLLKGELSSAKESSSIRISDSADVTVQGATSANSLMMSGGQMQAAGVQLRGQMLLTGGALTSSANVQAGDLLVAGGALAANNLTVQSLSLSNGALNIAQNVTVTRQLTMNYGGELSIGGALNVADGAVLSYNSAAENTLQLTLSDLSSINRLYVDVSQVSVADLRNGVDLGISYGAKDKLSIGSLASYTLENRDGQAFLVSNSKATRYNWDTSWGTEENAKAPETLPTVNWKTVAEKPGLANSSYYDKGNVIAGHVAGGTVTGNAPHVNQIFGGAYGTQPIDAAGGTIERNIWLAVSDGTFEIVGGGSFSLNSSLGTSSGAAAAYNLKGDTHVQIESGANIGSVFGSNVNNIYSPTHTGDSYISVYSRTVSGSVVGSGYMTKGQTGDTYVNIYAPLFRDEASLIVDRTLSDQTEGFQPYEIDANAVIGGVLDGLNADMQGNTTLNIIFKNNGGTMVKHLVGGNFGQTTQKQTGNTLLNVQHIAGGTFWGRVVGGHHYVDSPSAEQSRIGKTDVRINDAAGATFRDDIVGGHYWLASGNDADLLYYYNQDLQGDLSLTVTNAQHITINGEVMVAGHYAATHVLQEGEGYTVSKILNTALSSQKHTGNTLFALSDIKGARVNSILVGGHYYRDDSCEGHTQHGHNNDTVPVQEHVGRVDMSISRAEGAIFSDNVVAGHYVSTLAPDTEDAQIGATTLNTVQRQQGDVNLTIDSSSDTYAGRWLVGGHFSDAATSGLTTMSHKDGDIHVTIGNGTFNSAVVLGDVHTGPNEWLIGDNDWNSDIEGGTYLTVTGGTFNNAVIGASYSDGGGTAHVGSVNMDIRNAVFNGAIVGGFLADGTTSVGDIDISITNATVNAAIFGGTATRQGNITLALHGGSINGNIYAAGLAAEWTSSTTVTIDDNVKFKSGIRISGGFEGEGDNVVYGPKTLSFTSAGSTYANAAAATFTEFDTVNVVAADTKVTLRQNLQLMGQSVTKTGAGTLVLYKENELDNLIVREGTLRLAGNSRGQGGTLIEHLQVDKNGTLDISSGNCGVNGILTLAQGAGLAVRVNQAATAITDLNWEGLVELDILDGSDALDEGFEIKLFSGLSESHVSGLELMQIDGIDGLAAAAADYIDSDYTDAAYIVLREDGSLVLSAKERQAAYWLDGSGEWNSTDNRWYGQEIADGTPASFRNGARTYFVGNGTPADVQITEDVTPYSLTVREGTFHFDSATGKAISLKSDLSVEAADATFDNEVKFGKHSGISVDAAGTLALNGNDDVTVFDVDNAGTINVGTADMTVTDALRNSGLITSGSLALAQGTQQGGNVTTGDLKLGGDSSFDSVQAASVAVQTTLTVANDLVTDSLTLAGNTKGSPTPFVTAGSVSTRTPAADLDITIDNGVLLSNKALVADGGEFYVLRSEDINCGITLNGAALSSKEEGRYHYDFTVDGHGLKVSSTVMNVDHFASMAKTENGKAAAAMVDSLFTAGSTALADSTGDLAALVQALNTLDAAHDCAALEQLATAAAGASLPSLGLAVGNDMERQLRAIRNRTTTMGVDQTVTNEEMPYFNAWVNAEGDYRSVEGDNSEAGYTMSSFGGTVGFDADITPHLTCGLALTAMHGKYTSDDIDNADGNVTTEYLSVFGRYARHAWTHTFVASAGFAQADVDRTVQHAGGSYSTSGSTDGTAFGLMYEVGRVIALNAEGSACIQPFANVSFVHANLSGFEEEGSDAALTVDDMTYNAATFGLGARLQGVGGETVYNRSSIYELRALAKFHTGDRSVDADTSFAHGTPGTLHSAEIGAVGAEIGAGITLPVGGQGSSLFADVSVELNSAYTQVNGTVGYRINF